MANKLDRLIRLKVWNTFKRPKRRRNRRRSQLVTHSYQRESSLKKCHVSSINRTEQNTPLSPIIAQAFMSSVTSSHAYLE